MKRFNRVVMLAVLAAGGLWLKSQRRHTQEAPKEISSTAQNSAPQQNAFSKKKSLPDAAPKSIQTQLTFVRCHDGDTCTARTHEGIQVTLRLLGIDAPEVSGKKRGGKRKAGQAFGEEAKAYLNDRVKGRTLPVELRGNDMYHRYLAVIWDEKGQHRINEELAAKGYVFAYRDPRVSPDVRAWAEPAEDAARKAHRGMWALPANERPEIPAEYRKHNR